MSNARWLGLGWVLVSWAACAAPGSAQQLQPEEERAEPTPAAAPVPVDTNARSARNVVFAELLGNAGLYSINYERFITDDVSVRVGFEYFSFSLNLLGNTSSTSVVVAPVMLNYLGIGSRDHKLELGIGPEVFRTITSGLEVGATATVGYRYVPHDGGVTCNIGFTPIITRHGFLPWGGLGLGGAF